MRTVAQILAKVNKYRNPYSADDKVEWMDTVQRQIFQDVPHEAPPYTFPTVSGFAFYPLPGDCDPLGVKQVTIETKAGSNDFRPLRYISVESNERFADQDEFYSIQGQTNLYLNPQPTDDTEGRTVYLYYNRRPAELSASNLGATPDIDPDFDELLELGVKIRIARERGEVADKNNFQSDFDRIYFQYKKRYTNNFPEYPRAKDVMPMRRGNRGLGYGGRRGARWDLIPYE